MIKTLVACLLFCFALTVARPCLACWDGWDATIGKVTFLQAGDDTWSPERAREAARWGTRIDALLPAGASLASEHGTVTISTPTRLLGEGRWDGASFESLFSLAAKLLRARGSAAEIVRTRDAAPLTVQVFAAYDRKSADGAAARLDAKAEATSGFALDDTFYSAGGYPARHVIAHVVRETDASGRPIYRVLVGAFLERSRAVVARVAIRDVLGQASFVRPL